MEFASQICTTREQSERLLSLGLKKETADCCYYYYDGEYLIAFAEDAKYPSDIPAWSLHRLISIIQDDCPRLDIVTNVVWIKSVRFNADNIYDNLVNAYEWLIEREYFKKEYLEDK